MNDYEQVKYCGKRILEIKPILSKGHISFKRESSLILELHNCELMIKNYQLEQEIKEYEGETNLLEALKIEYDNMEESRNTIIDILNVKLEVAEDVLYEFKDKLEKIEKYSIHMMNSSDPLGDRYDEFNDILKIIKEERK